MSDQNLMPPPNGKARRNGAPRQSVTSSSASSSVLGTAAVRPSSDATINSPHSVSLSEDYPAYSSPNSASQNASLSCDGLTQIIDSSHHASFQVQRGGISTYTATTASSSVRYQQQSTNQQQQSEHQPQPSARPAVPFINIINSSGDNASRLNVSDQVASCQLIRKSVLNLNQSRDEQLRITEKYANELKSIDLEQFSFPNEYMKEFYFNYFIPYCISSQ